MTEEHSAVPDVAIFIAKPAPRAIDNQCMEPGCKEPARARGHCASHYRILRDLVNDPDNDYTWKILGDAGVVPLRAADDRERVDTAGFRDETLAKLNKASDAP